MGQLPISPNQQQTPIFLTQHQRATSSGKTNFYLLQRSTGWQIILQCAVSDISVANWQSSFVIIFHKIMCNILFILFAENCTFTKWKTMNQHQKIFLINKLLVCFIYVILAYDSITVWPNMLINVYMTICLILRFCKKNSLIKPWLLHWQAVAWTGLSNWRKH